MTKRQITFDFVLTLMTLLSGQIIFGTPVFGVTDASISISAPSSANLILDPGLFDSVSQSISITTDNYTGYTASLANQSGSTDLINTSDNTKVIPTITLPQGSSSITQSQFNVGYGFSTDGANYIPAPTSGSSIPLGHTTAAGANSHSLYVGGKVNSSIASGTYDKNFVITVVANNPQYALTFNANAGPDTVTGMPSDIPVSTATTSAITLPNATPNRDYYAFLGWDTNASATTPTYPAGSTNTIDIEPTQSNNITLYAIWEDTGTAKVTSVTYVSGINVGNTPHPTVDNDGNVNFDLTFYGGQDNTSTLQATYQLTITNTSASGYVFTAPEPNLVLRISENEVRDVHYELSGISIGDVIPAKSSVSFNVIITADYVSGEHNVEGDISVNPINQTTPSLIGEIYGSNAGDLSGNNTLAMFQVSVESTFEESQTFTIGVLSSDFEVVNSSGNPLGTQTIAANTTGTYTFYLKKTNGAKFASETASPEIIISYNDTYTNVGELRIAVDRDQSYVDTQAPIISAVTITKNKTTVGEATLTWSGTDNVGIASYGIYKCTSLGCDTMISVSGTTNSYTFTGMGNGTYYFIVVGFDDEGNTADQDQINGANTNPGAASRTEDTELRWTYNVTASITNGSISHASGTSIQAGGTYTGTIRPNSSSGFTSYRLPSTITVKMDGTTLTTSQYSYSASGSNAGRVVINNVSGDIEITAVMDASCLIEGTEIVLADGTTKPVEDITYHDKLKVWNYETGSIGEEYPAWIEKQRVVLGYQITTLEDGTQLKTHGWHGVFDVDANEFISIDDRSRLYAGVNIYKIEDDQLVSSKVVSVEYGTEEVNVYHVVSAKYYNIIANGVLTTDGTVVLSNLYGFDDNLKWPDLRNQVISDPDNLYTYADFEDIGMPERMFNDLRVEEAKYLLDKYGLPLELFKQYLLENQLNEEMWLPYDD